MIWVILAILASLFWAGANIIDKFVLSNQKPWVIMAFANILALISAVIVYFVQGFSLSFSTILILAILNGGIYAAGIYFYCVALQRGEASRIIPLFSLIPLLILLFATIFLKEVLAPIQYFGVFMIILGTILISINKKTSLLFDRAFLYAFIASIFFAANSVMMKFLLGFYDFWTVFSYERIGAFIFIIPILFIYRKELKALFKNKRDAILVSSSEILNILALILITSATALGLVSIVRPLSLIQNFFVLGISLTLSSIFPKIFKEDMNRKIIILKLVAITFLFLGVFLITS